MFDRAHVGFLAGDDYERAAELRAEQQTERQDAGTELAELAELVTGAAPEVLGRVMLAVAAQHEPGPGGHCRICAECQPRRWRRWRTPTARPCPTHRVMAAELQAAQSGPRFTPA